jgi:hypothetical protein
MEGADLEELNMLNEKRYTLEAALGDSIREFIYEYDFGDSWRHRIKVTPVTKPKADWTYPLCIAGARAAPPDDVGGDDAKFRVSPHPLESAVHRPYAGVHRAWLRQQ